MVLRNLLSTSLRKKGMGMEDVVEIRKSGKFYNTFGNDAIVIHYLLNYKIVKEKGGVGFPETAFNKVIKALEDNEVSYKIYEKNEITQEHDFKKLNNGKNNLSVEERVEKVLKKVNELNNRELDKLLKVIEDAIS